MATVDEEQAGSSAEQRMASYRQRIRVKLQARGCPAEELDQKTEELMHRKLPINFTQMARDV